MASQTNRRYGWVKGEPVRFLPGHNGRLARVDQEIVEPNPSGMCMCGCGEPAAVASQTSRSAGIIKGRPLKYARGKGHRLGPRRNDVDPLYVELANGCWEWQRYKGPGGYGMVRRGGSTTAHRWMYEREIAPIPEGFHLHHRCGLPACVNPAHLEPISPADHARLHHGG